MSLRRFAAISFFLAVSPLTALGQICPGSDLIYFVRDQKGKLISAAAGGLTFVDANEATERSGAPHWRIGRSSNYHVPEKLRTEAKDLETFTVSQMCSFRAPLVLKLTLKGKTMELRFVAPNLGMRSADYVVDSLPFKKGKYVIDLEVQPAANGVQKFGGFFPANLWKKRV